MILLWGITGDEPLDLVRRALERQRSHYAFLDQQRVENTSLDLEVGQTVSGHLTTGEFRIDLERVGAAYLRPYNSRRMRAVERAGATSPLRQHALSIEDGLLAWAEITSSLVLNRPSAMASNNSKPYQSRFIHAAGFRIPDTLVTTEVEAALEFWERHGDIIYKSVSGIRSIVSRTQGQRSNSIIGYRKLSNSVPEVHPGQRLARPRRRRRRIRVRNHLRGG